MSLALWSPPGVYFTTFVFSLVSGLVPFLNVEAYLVSLSALSPQTALSFAVVAASLGQMTAKCLLYRTGREMHRVPLGARAARACEAVVARLGKSPGRATPLVLVSAITGFPPFYGVSVAAGALRFPFVGFVAAGLAGRALRFGAVFLLPRFL